MITIPRELRLVGYVLGVYSCFLYWGFLQEKIFSTEYARIIDPDSAPASENVAAADPGEVAHWNFPFLLNFFMALACYLVAGAIEYGLALYRDIVNGTVGDDTISEGSDSIDNTISPYRFLPASLTCVMASPLSYEALRYIRFPLMILTKSAKPIPVMLVGTLSFGRRYTVYKYISVMLLVLGIALFSGYAHTSSPKSGSSVPPVSMVLQMYGIALVLVNLALDGYTNNMQDAIFDEYALQQQRSDKSRNAGGTSTNGAAAPAPRTLSGLVMMKYINFWQAVELWAYLLVAYVVGAYIDGGKSELGAGVAMLLHYDGVAWDVATFCLCACGGQLCVFGLMKEFGSLVWICVSVTRKLFTVLVSVVMFRHPVAVMQWLGIGAVFTGILLDTYTSYMDEGKKGGNSKSKDQTHAAATAAAAIASPTAPRSGADGDLAVVPNVVTTAAVHVAAGSADANGESTLKKTPPRGQSKVKENGSGKAAAEKSSSRSRSKTPTKSRAATPSKDNVDSGGDSFNVKRKRKSNTSGSGERGRASTPTSLRRRGGARATAVREV